MKPRRALSIRQPYAEQILRGTKTIEYRSQPTRIIGERIYIYASRQPGDPAEFRRIGATKEDLPIGVIVGTVEIERCTGKPGAYRWHLESPERLSRPRRPERRPQPVWFIPFQSRWTQ